MGLNKIKLGDYIERSTVNNSDLRYGNDLIVGVNSTGNFAIPRGNVKGVDLKPYKLVENEAFVYNPSRLNLGSIAYRTEGFCIVSHLYIVFYLNAAGKKIIDPAWLYMYFRRDEFFREVTFRNFGSQRPEFNFNDMSDIEIPLPPIEIQQKYVDIYNAMVANQKAYETGLEDLKLVCDGYIDRLKNTNKRVPIGRYIELTDNKNVGDYQHCFKGLSMENYFIDSIADANGIDFTKYKIVAPTEYAAVLMKVGRDCRLTIARNTSENFYLISPAYYTFRLHDINANYFMANVSRSEFERRGWFSCDTSARGSLSWGEFMNLTIPDVSDTEQQIVSELYVAQIERTLINENLKAKIKDICPILIKGSLEEAKEA